MKKGIESANIETLGACVLKKAGISDAPAFARINEKIWGTTATQEIVDYFRKGISRFQDGYYLALVEDQVVATSEAFPIAEKLPVFQLDQIEDQVDLHHPDGRFYYIHIIQVLPDFRKRGIGSLLLEKQVEVARNMKLAEVCGIVIADQMAHWNHHGFVEEGQWTKYKEFGYFKWAKKQICP